MTFQTHRPTHKKNVVEPINTRKNAHARACAHAHANQSDR